MQAAEKAAMPGASAIDKKINQELVPKILALNDPFQEVRSHIGALTYQIEVTHSESSKDSLRKEIEELKAEKHEVSLPGEDQKRSMNFTDDGRPAAGVEGREGQAPAAARRPDEAGDRAARQARPVSLGPDRRRQHVDDRGGAEFAGQVRYPHPADPREGCGPGGSLRDPATWARASRWR